jgi:2-iminoacetate synthase ThiH
VQFFVQRSELRDLYDKVAAGQRISEADALRLFESKDLNVVGAIADLARQRKVGARASYIVNRYVNYSNYCILSCQFCSFARKKRDADGFQLTVEEIVKKPARRSAWASPSCTLWAGCILPCRSATTLTCSRRCARWMPGCS